MPNLTRRDLRAFLPGHKITDDQADITILLVSGWLQGALALTTLPEPLDGPLWSAALELAALVIDNPTSRSQRTAGPTSSSWPMAPRRDAILAQVRAQYAPDRRGPQGSYPDEPSWPEPATVEVGAAEYAGAGWWWVEGPS